MNKLITRAFAAGALASALAALPALPAQATPITWNLSNVTFSDGTSATGSFTIDWDTKTWTSFNVATENGRLLSAFDYTPDNSGLYFNTFGPNSFELFANSGTRYMNFSFNQALTTPGTYAINTSFSWDCNNCGRYRRVTGGSVIGRQNDVPEPATLALMLPALAMIGVARRRKQK